MTRLNKPVSRVTREAFFNYGPDADKPFVATLQPTTAGSVLTLRPLRCRVASAVATIKLVDVYRYVLRCRENAKNLEKATAAKKKKADAKAQRAANRATKKLFATET